MDRNINYMNENHCPVNIYLDLSKAFDSLYYDILLSKLKYYGLQWKALQLLKSYTGAPNSAKFRGGYRGPSKIRQRGGCNNFLLFTR